FGVSRLSARHDIKVHLRTSPYGGTTAVVLLPKALLHSGAAEQPEARTTDTPAAGEHEHARVAGPGMPEMAGVSAPAQAPRPVLVAASQAAAHIPDENPADTTPPPGVATLRVHRPPAEHDGDTSE